MIKKKKILKKKFGLNCKWAMVDVKCRITFLEHRFVLK